MKKNFGYANMEPQHALTHCVLALAVIFWIMKNIHHAYMEEGK